MRKILSALLFLATLPFRFILWLLSTKELKAAFMADAEEDTPLPDVVSKVIENPIGVLEQLNELRKHLVRMVVFLGLAALLSLTFNHQILEFLATPLDGGMKSLVAIDPTEPIGTVMRVALLTGFAVSFPYLFYQVWLFIAPAILDRRNRLYGFMAIPIATLFFLGGMAFAFYIMMPAALPFLLNFAGITTIPRPSSYITFVTGLLFWIGIAFEFPLVIYVLARVGLVKANLLREQWRVAIVIIAIAAAMITPTIDPINMGLVMGPMILLYFLSVFLASIAQRSRERASARK